jgi:hypothetical protein
MIKDNSGEPNYKGMGAVDVEKVDGQPTVYAHEPSSGLHLLVELWILEL